MNWSSECVSTLRQLWADGLSASQIAKKLGGVTRNAVIGKVHRLRLPYRQDPGRRISVQRAKSQVVRYRFELKAKQYRRSKPVVPAPPPIPDKLGPIDPTLNVARLNAFTCRYPFGDPQQADFAFCGRTCEGPYCSQHRTVVYTRASATALKATERFAVWLEGRPRRQRTVDGFAL